MLMPAGAKPASASISMRLKEPLRRLPQMATMFMEFAPFLLETSPAHRRQMYELAPRLRNRVPADGRIGGPAVAPPAVKWGAPLRQLGVGKMWRQPAQAL